MRESAQAKAAFEDFWDMGHGRTIKALHERYLTVPEPPTTRITTLKEWSARYHWLQRCAEREAALAEQSEAAMVEERVQWKRERLLRAKLLYTAGQEVLVRFLQKVKELDAMPALTVEVRDDKGRLIDRRDGLVTLVPMSLRAVEVGHKEQRLEIGEPTEHQQISLEQILSALPGEFREQVESELERLMREGDPHGGGEF